ncbi:MAG: glycosyltransferase, partial [Pseudomonadota bacterium]
ARGITAARAAFAADRPAVVAGFGGYPALPALAAAWTMGLPRLIHEQNGVLGRVNRLFATRVDRVCCGTWPVRRAPAGAPLQHTGNPVRAAVVEARATPYAPPGADGPVRLLVFGGSQGASLFARVVPQAVAMLPEPLRTRLAVVQQARAGEEGAVAAAYRSAGVEAEIAPFFADMPRRIAEAQLVIARAGASSVAEIACIGRPAVLVPYAAAMDDHQTANAEALARAGGAEVIAEAALTAGALAALLKRLLGDTGNSVSDASLSAMAAAARGLGRPDAATDLADLVVALHTEARS